MVQSSASSQQLPQHPPSTHTLILLGAPPVEDGAKASSELELAETLYVGPLRRQAIADSCRPRAPKAAAVIKRSDASLSKEGLRDLYLGLGWLTRPVAPTKPATPAPSPATPRPPAASRTKPTLEHEFRRWAEAGVRALTPPPSSEPLSYEVYTTERLAARLRHAEPSAPAPAEASEIAPRHVAMFGFAAVVALLTLLVAMLGTSNEPTATNLAASDELVAVPMAVEPTTPRPLVIAPNYLQPRVAPKRAIETSWRKVATRK